MRIRSGMNPMLCLSIGSIVMALCSLTLLCSGQYYNNFQRHQHHHHYHALTHDETTASGSMLIHPSDLHTSEFDVINGQSYPKERDLLCGYQSRAEDTSSSRGYLVKVPTATNSSADGREASGVVIPHRFALRNMMHFTTRVPQSAITSVALDGERFFAILRSTAQGVTGEPNDLCVNLDGVEFICSPTMSSMISMSFPPDRPGTGTLLAPGSFFSNEAPVFQHVLKCPAPLRGVVIYGTVMVSSNSADWTLLIVRYREGYSGNHDFYTKITGLYLKETSVSVIGSIHEIVVTVMSNQATSDLRVQEGPNPIVTIPKCPAADVFGSFIIVLDSETGQLKRSHCVMSDTHHMSSVNTMTTDSSGNIYLIGMAGTGAVLHGEDSEANIIVERESQYIMMFNATGSLEWVTWVHGAVSGNSIHGMFLNLNETALLFLLHTAQREWVISSNGAMNTTMITPAEGNIYVVALDAQNGHPLKVSVLGSATFSAVPNEWTTKSKSVYHSHKEDTFYMCFRDRTARIFLRKFTDDGELLAERVLGKESEDGYIVSLQDFDIYEEEDGVTHVLITGTWARSFFFGDSVTVPSKTRSDMFIAHYTENCACENVNCRIPTCRDSQKFDPLVCHSRGICESVDKCACQKGYTGNDCEFITCFNKRSNEKDVCSGYGTCVAPDTCQCQEGRFGKMCEIHACQNLAYTDSLACSSGRGTCVASNQCRCNNLAWTGIECEISMAFDQAEACEKGHTHIIAASADIVAARRINSDYSIHTAHTIQERPLIVNHVSRIFIDNTSPKSSPHRGAVYVVGQYTRYDRERNATSEVCFVGRVKDPKFYTQHTKSPLEFMWHRESARFSLSEEVTRCPEDIAIDSKNSRLHIAGRLDFILDKSDQSGMFMETLDLMTGESMSFPKPVEFKIDSRSMGWRYRRIKVRHSYSTFLQMARDGERFYLAGNVAGPMTFSYWAQIIADPLNSPFLAFAASFKAGRFYELMFQLGSDKPAELDSNTKPETVLTAMQVASNGDIIVVGYWRHEIMVDTESYESSDFARGFIIRYSQKGYGIRWKLLTHSATSTSRLDFLSAHLDQFDNLYVAGTAFGSVTIDTLNADRSTLNSTSTEARTDGDPFVMRVDTNGNVAWLHRFARSFKSDKEVYGDLGTRSVSLVVSHKGNLFIAFGVRGSVTPMDGGTVEISDDRLLHMHIAKMKMLTGNIVWTKTFMHQLQQSSVWDVAYREDDDMLFVMGSYNSESDVVIAHEDDEWQRNNVVLQKSSFPAVEITESAIESPMDPFILVIRNSFCQPCPQGHFEVDGQCLPCDLNEYNDQTGAHVCANCPIGTVNNSTGNVHIESCIPCPRGTARSTNDTTCRPCSPNSYAPERGMESCLTCPTSFLILSGDGGDSFAICLISPAIAFALALVAATVVTLAISIFIFMCCKYRSARANEKTELEMALLGEDSRHGTSSIGSNSSHGLHIAIDHSMFDLSFNEFSNLNEIATGGSGAVIFTADWQKQKVVLKIWRLSPFQQEEEYGAFESEIRLLSSIRSQYVVNFLGAILEIPRVGIVLEYCSKGSLRSLLKRESLPWPRRLKLLHDLAMGMAFLHSRSIVHRDLKSDNVLVDKNYLAKVSDFGCSKRLSLAAAQQHTKYVGTSAYMAPEVTNGEQYNEKCDVFSFSIIMFEVLTLLEPYQGIPRFNIEVQVAKRPDLRPQVPDDVQFIHDHESRDPTGDQDKFISMMKRCWQHDQHERPSFDDILITFEELQENVSGN